MEIKTIHLKIGEAYEINLENYASAGYTMTHEIDCDDVVSITRSDFPPEGEMQGDPMKVHYRIVAQKNGLVHIRFLELIEWDKSEQPTVAGELSIEVE
jgi:hypothetical protein